MLKSGVHAKVVSERLGHSTISITLDLYSHILPEVQEAAAAKLDDMLSNVAGRTR
jgi:integrase